MLKILCKPNFCTNKENFTQLKKKFFFSDSRIFEQIQSKFSKQKQKNELQKFERFDNWDLKILKF